jgi:hypothetical protein
MAWKAQLANIQLDVYQTRADELKAPPKKAAPSPQQDEQDPVVPVQSTTVSKSAAAAGYEDEVEANGGDYSKHSKSRLGRVRHLTAGFPSFVAPSLATILDGISSVGVSMQEQ